MSRLLKALYQFLREVSGENDYERYRKRALASGETPLPPRLFYLQSIERKYSRINRCC
jgi:Selenoprotein, putative